MKKGEDLLNFFKGFGGHTQPICKHVWVPSVRDAFYCKKCNATIKRQEKK